MHLTPTLKQAIIDLFTPYPAERHIDSVRSRIAAAHPNRWRLNYEYVVTLLNNLAKQGVLQKVRPGYFRLASTEPLECLHGQRRI